MKWPSLTTTIKASCVPHETITLLNSFRALDQSPTNSQTLCQVYKRRLQPLQLYKCDFASNLWMNTFHTHFTHSLLLNSHTNLSVGMLISFTSTSYFVWEQLLPYRNLLSTTLESSLHDHLHRTILILDHSGLTNTPTPIMFYLIIYSF